MSRRVRTSLLLALAVVAAVAVVAGSLPVTPTDSPAPPNASTSGGGIESTTPADRPSIPGARDAIAALLALAVTAAVGSVAAWRSLRDADPDPAVSGDDGATDSSDLDAVADAAGRAARRIERADPDAFDNEVYHAWRAMTVALGADGDRTRTPTEFRRLAVDAGMAPADVRELTELFRRVRYGDAEATPDLEERATDLLWRIDREYGER